MLVETEGVRDYAPRRGNFEAAKTGEHAIHRWARTAEDGRLQNVGTILPCPTQRKQRINTLAKIESWFRLANSGREIRTAGSVKDLFCISFKFDPGVPTQFTFRSSDKIQLSFVYLPD
jgi:hypothetical protein